MQKRAIEIAVGSFFLLGVAALVLLALKVSGLMNGYKAETHAYQVAADFEHIGNLKPRARVTIAGVRVGRVTAIELNPETYLAKVTLAIDQKMQHLPIDTQASILTAGLLGDNYVALVPGFETHYLKNGDHISVQNTSKALILEQLISKFLAGQASGLQ